MHLTDGSGHINNAFVEEDAAAGRPAAMVTAAWLNAVQAEIAAVITQDGGALAKANNAQLAAAVLSLIGKAVTAHKGEADPHPVYETSGEAAAKVAAHETATDPHPQYMTAAEVDAAMSASTSAARFYYFSQF